MTETSPLAAAHQAIGAYYCQFSRVEHELGESVKVVYALENNEASDAVVAALGDVARKASLVWAASKGAKDTEGREASEEWKAKVEATIRRIFDMIEFHSPTPCCNRTPTVPSISCASKLIMAR